jgi:hypothetical protein
MENLESFMRAGLAFVVVVALWAGEAEASSFVVLELEPTPISPSIVELGEPVPPSVATLPDVDTPAAPEVVYDAGAPGSSDQIIELSPSMIALGEPDVAMEKVAAIGGENKRPRHDPLPMVIRGGVVGDAFSPAATGAPVPLTVEPESSERQASEAPSTEGSSKPAGRTQEPEPPEPAPAPPAAPTAQPE